MKNKQTIMRQVKQQFIYFLAVGVSIGLLFFFVGSVWIGHEVLSLCQSAKGQYGGDCVKALATQLSDEQQDFRTRNHAIWALGQMGDNRALPVLQKYYTGNIPNREPLDGVLSQYELQKAIKLASGGLNITAWVWRWEVK